MKTDKSPAKAIDKSLLSELVRGGQKTFENAETLYKEASLLREAGSLSHALFLHQISLEECAKIEILGGWATSMLMGHEVDLDKVTKALASHAHKNRTNAYFLEPSDDEKDAKQKGDFEAATKAFKQMQQEFHLKANTAKNASLYVDFQGGKFIAPNERITEQMLSEIAKLNEKYLSLSYPKIDLLRKLEKTPELISAEVTQFEKRIEELASELPDDPERVIEVVLKEMLEARLKAKANNSSSDEP